MMDFPDAPFPDFPLPIGEEEDDEVDEDEW